jgi:hypothetical protein
MHQSSYFSQAMLVISESKEIKEDLNSTIEGIKEAIPFKKWFKIVPYPEDDTDLRVTQEMWLLIGATLDAFYNDKPNPLTELDLSQELKSIIQKAVSQKLILAIIIFESEHFIKQAAESNEIEYPFEKRSDLIKCLIFEECLWQTILILQDCKESISFSQFKERSRIEQKYFNNKISDEEYLEFNKKWDKEDSKLQQPDLPDEREIKFWTCFCNQVFMEYKKQIPSIKMWASTFDIPKGKFKKTMVINGRVRQFKGSRSRKRL